MREVKVSSLTVHLNENPDDREILPAPASILDILDEIEPFISQTALEELQCILMRLEDGKLAKTAPALVENWNNNHNSTGKGFRFRKKVETKQGTLKIYSTLSKRTFFRFYPSFKS